MTTPNPTPDPDPKSTLAALIDAFTKLPAALSYGGLVLIAIIVLVWLTGNLPDILLIIPVVVLLVWILYGYQNHRFEIEKERLKQEQERQQQELEKFKLQKDDEYRRLQLEIERLKVEQMGDLEKAKLKQETTLARERLKAEQPQPAPSPSAPAAPPAPATWPHSYYRAIWQKCAQLHMTSIDPKSQELGASVLNLHSVFTSLDVPALLERELDERQQRALLRDPREVERQGREPALTAFSRPDNRRLVLLGQPGSGKSTLIKYLALCLSGEGIRATEPDRESETTLDRLKEQGWQLPALLPLLVILRDYAAKGLPQKQSLWAFITTNLKNDGLESCHTALSQHLKQQGGLLLLDGLDEVPEAHQRREDLRDAILRFVREFPDVRIIVTSRPYAYQNPAWQLPGFTQTTLLDFTPKQVETYIDRWYTVAAPQDPNLGEDRAKQYASQLKHQVGRNENLRELAPRPLLLALMVSLHRWRGGGLLPERREQLYDHSVNLLLDLWQRPKLIFDEKGQPRQAETNALTELKIEALALRRALSQLAFEVHRDQPEAAGTADIPHEKLVAALRQAVPKEKRDDVKHKKIAEYVRDRAGLLEDRGEDVYGFPHRTFQEYLAAMHLLDQEDFPENLVPLVRQDPTRWREAALLAGNSANTTLQWALVEQLYGREDAPLPDEAVTDEGQWWGVYLAGQVLHDSDLLKKETKLYKGSLRQVQNWHKTILTRGVLPPRDRAQAGDLLAELGDDRPGVLNCDDMPLCYVPPGEFWMGDERKDTKGHWNNSLDKPYWLAQYPVTVAQFRQFVQDSRFKPSRGNRPFEAPDNRPVVYVNWYDALAFCDWLTRRWQKQLPPGYRVTLPSEAEWEKAARGGKTIPATIQPDTIATLRATLTSSPVVRDNDLPQRPYPWGNQPEPETVRPDKVIYRGNSEITGIGRASAVGSFPAGASPYGCLDMAGNVWEWTRSYYGKNYPYQSSAAYETIDPNNRENIVLRGGSFYNGKEAMLCSARVRSFPVDFVDDDWGFRVGVASPITTSDR